ncbi:MAG TPA: hypothetical protein VD793_03410 [Gemmatimonadales bacterium]|nr:hypothetical protein [Gemmatimonadales bacterium]
MPEPACPELAGTPARWVAAARRGSEPEAERRLEPDEAVPVPVLGRAAWAGPALVPREARRRRAWPAWAP